MIAYIDLAASLVALWVVVAIYRDIQKCKKVGFPTDDTVKSLKPFKPGFFDGLVKRAELEKAPQATTTVSTVREIIRRAEKASAKKIIK